MINQRQQLTNNMDIDMDMDIDMATATALATVQNITSSGSTPVVVV